MKRIEWHQGGIARAIVLLGAAASWGCFAPGPDQQPSGGTEKASAYHATDATIVLRDAAGNTLTPTSTTPYSPRATCGGTSCHSIDTITQGYHFQQGSQIVADNYNTAKPWLLSDGMYGKW